MGPAALPTPAPASALALALALVPARGVLALVPLRKTAFQPLTVLSKAETTTTLALGASPPPAILRRQGCFPSAILLRAMCPAWVGPAQARLRRLARLLPQAPQRVQNANGAGP